MTCPICDRATVPMVFLIICAHCEKAWLPYEYESLWIARERRDQAAGEEKKGSGE